MLAFRRSPIRHYQPFTVIQWQTFCEVVLLDELIKSRETSRFVIPALAGIL